MSPLEFVCFVTAVLLLYYLLPRKAQPYILLAAGLFYCLSVSLLCLLTLLGVTVNVYLSAIAIERRRSRRVLAVGIALTLASLVINKFSTAFLSGAVTSRGDDGLQGVAFYSLSAVAYLIDLHRGRIKRESSFLKLFLFIGFFPCLRLGPVMRYGDIAPQLCSPHAPEWDNIVSGALRVSFGYFKKIVLADTALVALRVIVAEPQKFGGGYALFLIILYSVVIYADFTGGIDIALGVSRALGVILPENFDRPFSSESVREYWKRWHITLGAFFSDYIFYPLSISKPMRRLSKLLRGSKTRRIWKRLPIYIALVATWLLTGVWHGLSVNYILWGLSNAAVIIIAQEVTAARASHYICAVRTFLIIGAIRLFDLWSDPAVAFRTVLSIFFDFEGWRSFLGGKILTLGLSVPEWAVIICGIALVIAISRASLSRGKRVDEILTRKPLAATSCIAFLVLATLIFGSYGVGFEESSFIYSQF